MTRKPSAPYVITDTIAPTRSGADGRVYTSKSAIRRSYRASGNPQGIEYSEIGNDRGWREKERSPAKPDRKGVDEAIRKAVSRLNT